MNMAPQFERWKTKNKTKRQCNIKEITSISLSYKQIMDDSIRTMVRIFSFGERWSVPNNSASPSELASPR